MVFCLATDRNGYIPVHNRKYSLPQRPDDALWNKANCRNKRIIDDRGAITAARSSRPFTVQTARDMGGGGRVDMLRGWTPRSDSSAATGARSGRPISCRRLLLPEGADAAADSRNAELRVSAEGVVNPKNS